MRLRVCAIALLAALTPSARGADGTAALRDLTEADVAAWSQLHGDPLLSPDGRWLVYIWSAYDDSSGHPRKGVPQLIVRATDGDLERQYVLGDFAGAKSVKMSDDGRWIAYTKAGAATGRAVVAAMDLASGASGELSEGEAFEFGERGRWVVVRGYSERARHSGDSRLQTSPDSPEKYELSVHQPGARGSNTIMRWSGVTEHALDAQGRNLAFIDEHGLHLFDLRSKRERRWSGEPDATYGTLRWSPQGRSLALLRKKDGRHSLVVVGGLGEGAPDRRVFDPVLSNGLPRTFEIATQAKAVSQLGPLKNDVLRWRDEEDGLFFNIQRADTNAEQGTKGSKGSKGSKVADLMLWHGRDPWLPTEKVAGSPERYLTFLSLVQGRFVRLADETLGTVIPQGRGRYALGFTWRPYGIGNAICPSNIWGGREQRDYALVDLHTGERRPLEVLRGLEVRCHLYWPGVDGSFAEGHAAPEPQLSPDGEALVYLDQSGNYAVHDVERGTKRDVTRGIVGWLSQAERGTSREYPMSISVPSLQGWTADGHHLLVSDGYDVWSLPLKGGHTRNLTGDGGHRRIVYDFADFFARRAPGLYSLGYAALDTRMERIDLDRPLYFAATDTQSSRTGLAVRNPGELSARVVAWEDAAAVYYKAQRAPVYVASVRGTAPDGLNFYRLDDRWQRQRQLTNLAPQLAKFHWPLSRLLKFDSPRGEDRHAVLYVPPGEVPPGGHPTIVSIYQSYGVADMRNAGDPNNDRELFRWLRHGYAVLRPDIPQVLADPGVNALERVMGAVRAGVATGLIDRDRLGLYGHSYGGYEAFYIVTQTALFKAAVPVAGVSNLQSFYNNLTASLPVYPAWLGSSWIESNAQSYIGAPWWEERSAYQRNSPIEHATDVHTPLLIAHGDADTNVPFNQSMEMFIVLRRLQRPVVLLQYAGVDHSVDSHPDLMERELQFFDHFLKGRPAPAWWSKEMSYYKGQAPQPANAEE